LSSPEYRLRGGLQKNAAEANRSGESRGSTSGKTAGSSQQLLHSRDQFAYDRGVRMSGTIRLTQANETCFGAFDR
jgi:hypothetical protein